jgi:hypothetical protein
MNELAKWDNFYVIVGSSAGALIGLQFVVLTLIADRPHTASPEAGAAFGSPTVVHFAAALFLSAMLQAPWQTMTAPAAIWGVLGFIGVAYTAVVWRRMRRQSAYKPEFEDWLFHVILPLMAYAILAASWFAAGSHTRESLFGVGAATLLLLFDGIHNSWDNVSYHVLVNIPRKQREQQSAESKSTVGS